MIYALLIVFFIVLLIAIWMFTHPDFGHLPTGDRLKTIRELANFKNGELKNLSPTPVKPDNISYWDILGEMLKKNENKRPKNIIPSVKPDFRKDPGTKIIWFGHSSYFIQIDNINILVDPVFSDRTSPFSFIGTKSFKGTDFIKSEDFPELDIILITHDHYDHLDYKSILKLKDKTKHFITSLGVGAHLTYWGIPSGKITELSWAGETIISTLKFTAVPARHFSGRLFKRNQTAWSAFILQSAQHKLYLGGDSGYDIHFKEAGEKYGPFDIAILECGQYNDYWPLIHMSPEETVNAAVDLRAKVLLPVHWGKFILATHNWNDPIIRLVKKAKEENFKTVTPLPGESIILDQSYPSKVWW